jgi:hypothetical protein
MEYVLMIVALSLMGYINANTGKAHNAAQASARATSIPETRNISEHSNIDRTLRMVAENMIKIDVNADGKHNCIDAAVLFYQYYPDKSKVCIELNNNPTTKMNHLFNCVFTDGTWKAIEPQAYATNNANYSMKAVWGYKYDKSYNRDATEEYKRYIKR